MARGIPAIVTPEVLQWARDLDRITIDEIAQKLNVDKIEKENDALRDKLRVYNAIIDRYDLGRFFGKNRDMGRSRDEAR